jgi:hypothetical protein
VAKNQMLADKNGFTSLVDLDHNAITPVAFDLDTQETT